MSKTSNPVPNELVDAIKKIHPDRLSLIADAYLDLTGRVHILRRIDNRLTKMSPEQTAYAMSHPIVPFEL
ncbi:MAG: hypothetical protein NTW30_03975 [Candidatus Aenigmarchaeota archaeon]|nr:hypothetical protein [Candidatus Aenigmarchaeota archaeon]